MEISSTKIVLNQESMEEKPVPKERHESEKVAWPIFLKVKLIFVDFPTF